MSNLSGVQDVQESKHTRIAIWIIYFIGIVHWLGFFFLVFHEMSDRALIQSFINNPNPVELFESRPFDANDWYREMYMQEGVQIALRTHTVPFHLNMTDNPGLSQTFHKNRFLGTPSWTMSPQVILLYFLDTQTFAIVNLLFLYSIGFLGCLLLRKHYQLGLLPFFFLFLLFNFNGYFVEKITAYGPSQLGYFLMPYMILVMFRAMELKFSDCRNHISLGVWLGVVLVAMLYQGSLHLYVECVTFVLIWRLANYRLWRVPLVAFLVTFSVGFVRLFPAAVSSGTAPNHHYAEWGGYTSPQILINAFVDLRTQLDSPAFGWWEQSLYVSLPGLFLLVFLGMVPSFLKLSWEKFTIWKSLTLPCIIMLLISIRHFKHYIIPNWIPLLNAESMTTRYMIIPLALVTVIAAINLQGLLKEYCHLKRVKYLMVLSIGVITCFLFNHTREWRMHKVQDEFYWWHNSFDKAGLLYHQQMLGTHLYINNNMGDIIYIAAFYIGLLVSLLSSIVVVCWLWRDWKRGRARGGQHINSALSKTWRCISRSE